MGQSLGAMPLSDVGFTGTALPASLSFACASRGPRPAGAVPKARPSNIARHQTASGIGGCGPAAAIGLLALAGRQAQRRSKVAAGASRGSDLAETTKLDPPDLHAPNMELEFAERVEDALMKTGREHSQGITMWNQPGWAFWDVAKIFVKSGKGGNGCKSFHREKHMPNMGPDGGDGGHGGDVFLECAPMSNTLKQLRERVHYSAQNGGVGLGDSMRGADGRDKVIRVPPGTVVYVRERWVPGDDKFGENLPYEQMLIRNEGIKERRLIGELTQHGQRLRVAKGGKGGKGNESFKTHRNTAPFFCTHGTPGRGRWLELELKIIADVGIIGVPNAGKSSFLYAVTEKKPRIAAYPFTTTVPNLGYYDYDVHGGITLCDVPGLIEGASEGRGMGFMFLRHVERCQTLIHVIAGDSEDPIGDFETIQKELRDYSTEVAMKPQVIVVNKCDLPEVQERLPALMKELRRRCGHTRVFNISAATRHNTEELMERVYKWHRSVVRKGWDENGSPASDATHVVGRRELTQLGGKVEEVGRGEPVELDKALPTGRRQKSEFQAKVEWDVIDEAWRVIHPEVEQVALRTDWTYTGGYDRLNSIMKKTGASEALKQTGVKEGEIVIVGNTKFSYNPEMVGKEANMLYGQLELKTVKEEDYKEKNPARM